MRVSGEQVMSWKTRRGFTLVELLVVIAIIGVLVGLLIPAVNFARETGRKAQCLNNLRGVGQALVNYESDKGSFPGRVERLRIVFGNRGRTNLPVSWMTKLLPYLEQGNLLERIQSGMLTTAVELEIVTCPSDPPTGEVPFRLSYVMNCGVWDRDFGDEPADWVYDLAANGVGHVNFGNSPVKLTLGYIASNDGATNTLVASENLNAVSGCRCPARWKGWIWRKDLHGMVWTTQTTNWLGDRESPDS